MFLFIILLFFQLSSSKRLSKETTSYCSINSNHVLCNDAKIDTKCGKNLKTIELNRMDQQEILSVINNWRIETAEGKIDGKTFSEKNLVANMMKMEWNDELQKIATAISKKCEPYKSCYGCIDLHMFPSTFVQKFESFSEEPKTPFFWVPFLQKIFNRGSLTTDKNNNNDNSASSELRPFDIMTWAEINLMGCSLSNFRKDKMFRQNFVCAFGPVVPSRKKSASILGYPCSSCPRGSHCSTDNALCACEKTCFSFEYDRSPRVRRQGSRGNIKIAVKGQFMSDLGENIYQQYNKIKPDKIVFLQAQTGTSKKPGNVTKPAGKGGINGTTMKGGQTTNKDGAGADPLFCIGFVAQIFYIFLVTYFLG